MPKKATHFWIDPDELARKGIDYCSRDAQWLWLKVMRLLHASERYGHSTRDGKSVTDDQAARRCGIGVAEWIALRDELIEFDLLKVSGDGIIFSPELVAQAEWRAKEAKRQKEFQERKRREKSEKSNSEYNGYITNDITGKSRPNLNSNSFSSSDEKEKGGGSNAREREKLPAAAVQTRQWSELTDEEKEMSAADFATHLQKLHPKKNVRAIAQKVAAFCKKHEIAFALERVKGWVEGEHKTVNEAEFLAAFENEENKSPRQKAIENCLRCDERGLIFVSEKWKECNHKNA